jgi:hypothetical protein
MSRGSYCALDPADSRCVERPAPRTSDSGRLTTGPIDRTSARRPGVLPKQQGELDVLFDRAIALVRESQIRSAPRRIRATIGSDGFAPRLNRGNQTWANAVRIPRRQTSGLVTNAIYILCGIAATGGFAAFVQETQVNAPMRNSDRQSPWPDHVNVIGVWLHPALYELLENRNISSILSSVDGLHKFIILRGLSFSGSVPIMRIETAWTFDDRIVQSRFGLKYSYVERRPDQILGVLSALCDAKDESSATLHLQGVPVYRLDVANLPEPMDAEAVLDLMDRRQGEGVVFP